MDRVPPGISELALNTSAMFLTGNANAVSSLFFAGSVAGTRRIRFELEVAYPITTSNAPFLFMPTEKDATSFKALRAFKNLQDVPEYHVVVPLSEDSPDHVWRARNALKDVASFSVGMNKKGAFEVVIGYATSNSNRIRLVPATDPAKNKLDTALAFPVKNIAEVFKANSDIPGGTLSINSAGISRVYFKSDKYTCTYYQFANKKA